VVAALARHLGWFEVLRDCTALVRAPPPLLRSVRPEMAGRAARRSMTVGARREGPPEAAWTSVRHLGWFEVPWRSTSGGSRRPGAAPAVVLRRTIPPARLGAAQSSGGPLAGPDTARSAGAGGGQTAPLSRRWGRWDWGVAAGSTAPRVCFASAGPTRGPPEAPWTSVRHLGWLEVPWRCTCGDPLRYAPVDFGV